MNRYVRYLQFSMIAMAFCMLSVGCADTNKPSTTQPLTADERQKQILADPMHYGPTMDPNTKSGLSDESPTLKKDLDYFFNP